MYRRFGKRLFDIISSFLAILFLCPIILIIAILVRLRLGKPILFKQKRPGRNEIIFTLYKFRTMTNQRNSSGESLPDEIRLTHFGKILRATSLDELPEFINILRGDMSIVGPRPLLVEYLPRYNEVQKHRHDVRPGLTGLAQINGRNSISWEDKFELDLEYVKKVSFYKDTKIILITVKRIITRNGINSDNAATMEAFQGDRKN